jgi:hypothetical protein
MALSPGQSFDSGLNAAASVGAKLLTCCWTAARNSFITCARGCVGSHGSTSGSHFPS